MRPLSVSLRATSTRGATVSMPRPSQAQYSAQCSRSDPPWSSVIAVPPSSEAPRAAAPGATMRKSRADEGASIRDAAAPAMRTRTKAATAGSEHVGGGQHACQRGIGAGGQVQHEVDDDDAAEVARPVLARRAQQDAERQAGRGPVDGRVVAHGQRPAHDRERQAAPEQEHAEPWQPTQSPHHLSVGQISRVPQVLETGVPRIALHAVPGRGRYVPPMPETAGPDDARRVGRELSGAQLAAGAVRFAAELASLAALITWGSTASAAHSAGCWRSPRRRCSCRRLGRLPGAASAAPPPRSRAPGGRGGAVRPRGDHPVRRDCPAAIYAVVAVLGIVVRWAGATPDDVVAQRGAASVRRPRARPGRLCNVPPPAPATRPAVQPRRRDPSGSPARPTRRRASPASSTTHRRWLARRRTSIYRSAAPPPPRGRPRWPSEAPLTCTTRDVGPAADAAR